MTLTKKKIADRVYKEMKISRSTSNLFIDKFLNIIKLINTKNKSIKIARFGTFSSKTTKKRIGRNPITKKEYIIVPRNKLVFRPSSFLKNILN